MNKQESLPLSLAGLLAQSVGRSIARSGVIVVVSLKQMR